MKDVLKNLPKKISPTKAVLGVASSITETIDSKMDLLKSVIQQRDLIRFVPSEEKLVILIDIVNFSKNDSRTQFADIFIFQKYMRSFIFSQKFSFEKKIRIQNFIPTGDGCYIICEKCDAVLAVDFLITMISGFQNLLDFQNEPMGIRCSALIGECIPFIDLAFHKNYVGNGMNEASRILAYRKKILEDEYIEKGNSESEAKNFSKNSLFLGKSLFADLDFSDVDKNRVSEIHTLKDVVDKHGKIRDVVVLRGIKKL